MHTKTFYTRQKPMGKPRSNRHTRSDALERYHIFAEKLRYEMKSQNILQCELEDAIQIDIYAKISMPKSWSKKKRDSLDGELHRQKPDKDNIEKAVTDAMFYKAPCDDSGIACGWTEKRWIDGDPYIEIVVHFI